MTKIMLKEQLNQKLFHYVNPKPIFCGTQKEKFGRNVLVSYFLATDWSFQATKRTLYEKQTKFDLVI